MKLDKFYNSVRKDIDLTPANVSGFDKFLTIGEGLEVPRNQLAYVLATVYWETAHTMQPVKEAYWVYPHDPVAMERWRKKNLRYYPYYGRSYPQFTWEKNYEKATHVWNEKYRGEGPSVNFLTQPDLIMDPQYGVPLTFDAMLFGWFTNKSLGDYIDSIDESDEEDMREMMGARRVVNGSDQARSIAKLGILFEKGLKAAGY